jgi:intracellular septation protein
MKFLFDIFPVILFFIAFKWAEGHVQAAQALLSAVLGGLATSGGDGHAQAPVLLATVVTIAATFVQIGWLLLRRRKVDGMLWMSLAIVTVFGGATLYFHSEVFIKWKPTILYWCFGVSLLVSLLVFGRNLVQKAMGDQIALPEPVWRKLALAWSGFFLVMGVLNLIVAFTFPLPVWVNFKLFGGIGLMFVFIIAQSVFLSKYVEEDAP